MGTERDRFYGQGHFNVRVVLDIESNSYDTQAPTEEEAKDYAHEQCIEQIRFYLQNIATSDTVRIVNIYTTDEEWDLTEATHPMEVA